MNSVEKWSISLPRNLSRTAERVARTESRTRSELVREALRIYIRRIAPPIEFEESPKLPPGEVVSRMRETGLYSRKFLEDLAEALAYAD